MLILIAVLNRRKSKSAQYRFLLEREKRLCRLLGMRQLPTRSTYFLRYRQAHKLLQLAVYVQGRRALGEGIADATTVAADKSIVAAKGGVHHPKPRMGEKPSRGVDLQAGWGYSEHDQWVYGYAFETVVTASPHSLVFPLLASVDAANVSEHRSLPPKIPSLPKKTRHVLADRGYDSNAIQEAIERDKKGHLTRRRFLCPLIMRAGKPKVGQYPHRGRRGEACRQRRRRLALMESRRGKWLYKRRSKTIEPFHEWFKSCFELEQRVWHRGLDNNRTQILAAMVAYQLLVRYNHRQGRRNGQIQWLMDRL